MTGAIPDDPLTQLAVHFGTDKWGTHSYTPIYHELFAPLRDRPLRLLEIGVERGASIRMWDAYFHNAAAIVGLDVVAGSLDLGPRVSIRCGSQSDAAMLSALSSELGPFDIVIDDASHRPSDVLASFKALFPIMSAQGFYVIEDTLTAFDQDYGGRLDGAETAGLWSDLFRWLHHADIRALYPDSDVPEWARSVASVRAHHELVVVERGDNTRPSWFARPR